MKTNNNSTKIAQDQLTVEELQAYNTIKSGVLASVGVGAGIVFVLHQLGKVAIVAFLLL